jgi:hypothetical protein
MFTLTQEAKEYFESIFNENEKLEKLYIEKGCESFRKYNPDNTTTKNLENKYLEQLKTQPDLEVPSSLYYRTITGIEEQIRRHEKSSDTLALWGIKMKTYDTFTLERFLLAKP